MGASSQRHDWGALPSAGIGGQSKAEGREIHSGSRYSLRRREQESEVGKGQKDSQAQIALVNI